VPDLNDVGKEQERQQEGARHLNVLGGEQHLSPVQTIREDPAEQGKHDDGQLSQKEVQTQVEGILGEVVDQPALGELLYEGADGGDTCPQPHKAEITVAKSPEDAREEW
jgi:hypothetical protein